MTDAQKETIKSYVLIIKPDHTNSELADFIIESVVERAVIYMNRQNLDAADQLPKQTERVLAEVVANLLKKQEDPTTDRISSGIKRLKDNGQEIEFSAETSHLQSTLDDSIFLGVSSTLDRFKLGNVVQMVSIDEEV